MEPAERAAGSGRPGRVRDWIAWRLMQRRSGSGRPGSGSMRHSSHTAVPESRSLPPAASSLDGETLNNNAEPGGAGVGGAGSRARVGAGVGGAGSRARVGAGGRSKTEVLLSLGKGVCWLIGLGRRPVAGRWVIAISTSKLPMLRPRRSRLISCCSVCAESISRSP
jgi:hypothetical protein